MTQVTLSEALDTVEAFREVFDDHYVLGYLMALTAGVLSTPTPERAQIALEGMKREIERAKSPTP